MSTPIAWVHDFMTRLHREVPPVKSTHCIMVGSDGKLKLLLNTSPIMLFELDVTIDATPEIAVEGVRMQHKVAMAEREQRLKNGMGN